MVLVPLSAVFAAATALRRAAYRRGWLRSAHAAVPVIVVGNLSVGGTGKTPFVIWLAQQLTERGVAAGIVSRGYGGSHGPGVMHVTASTPADQCGDEPALIARATGLPVAVSHSRMAACQALVARGVKLIIADDGLQHYALARELEIVLIDGGRGLGNGRALPAGPLRESPARLHSVQAVIFNDGAGSGRCVAARPADSYSMRLRPATARNLHNGAQRELAEFAAAGIVHAVAAIANPGRYFAMLRGAGLSIIEHAFPDHHAFAAQELTFGDAQPVLMTAKDAVKCGAFADERLWEIPVDAEFSAADAARLLALVMALEFPATTA